MADEQTPQPFGNEVDPSGTGPVEPVVGAEGTPEQAADSEQVAARARSSRPVRRTAGGTGGATAAAQPSTPAPRPVRRRAEVEETDVLAPVADKPVRREAAVATTNHRTTPAMFVNQSAAELRKVIWPTATQLRQYFIVVLLFVLFIVAYVGVLDAGFGWLVLKLFGKH